MRTELSARERIVYSAAKLISCRGVSATGLREIVAHANAPRGSLQHYFPGGKDQLIREALNWAGEEAGGQVERFMAELDPPTPAGLFAAMVDQWRTEFAAWGFDHGCPLTAATSDTAAVSDSLREVASGAFAHWQQPLHRALTTMSIEPARADSLALLMISTLEGAIILARAHQNTGPFDVVVAELRPLLDGAVRPSS